MHKSRLHVIWAGMKSRCQNPKRFGYDNYGGRGIYVCDQWAEFVPFMQWSLSNGYSDDLELDRIDNDGPYAPENCRWVTRSENMRNRRPAKPLGLRYTVRELVAACDALGINPSNLLSVLPKKRLYNEAGNLDERRAHNERVRDRAAYRDSERCRVLNAGPAPVEGRR